MKVSDLGMRLVKHFVCNPGSCWSVSHIALIFCVPISTAHRQIAKLKKHEIIIKLGTGYTLNPLLVSELRGTTMQQGKGE